MEIALTVMLIINIATGWLAKEPPKQCYKQIETENVAYGDWSVENCKEMKSPEYGALIYKSTK